MIELEPEVLSPSETTDGPSLQIQVGDRPKLDVASVTMRVEDVTAMGMPGAYSLTIESKQKWALGWDDTLTVYGLNGTRFVADHIQSIQHDKLGSDTIETTVVARSLTRYE